MPTIGLIAHVDTYHEVTGTNVNPQVHRDYDGGDIVLPGDPNIVIRASEEPALAACRGLTIITTDGTTLLGGDDKAGVAEILEVLWRYKEHPERLHGPIRVGFTPDEEVGRGTEHFDVKKFAADFAYTVDGSGVAEIEDETFCADSAFVTVTGADVHPGYAKGKMINAMRVMSDIIMALPQHRTPETTEKREGYLHPIIARWERLRGEGAVHRARFHRGRAEAAGGDSGRRGRLGRAEVPGRAHRARDQGVVPEHEVRARPGAPRRASTRRRLSARTGLTPKKSSIRGGTDGARLSFMGLLTPNLFDGSMNFHGKKEWIALEWMEKSVETIGHLMDIWVERSGEAR